MIVVDNKYSISQVVYLTTDDEQLKRIVTCILVHSGTFITYALTQGVNTSYHNESEISTEKTLIL